MEGKDFKPETQLHFGRCGTALMYEAVLQMIFGTIDMASTIISVYAVNGAYD